MVLILMYSFKNGIIYVTAITLIGEVVSYHKFVSYVREIIVK